MSQPPGDPVPLHREASGRVRPAAVPGPTWVDRCAWACAAAMLKPGRLPSEADLARISYFSYELAVSLAAERDRRFPPD